MKVSYIKSNICNEDKILLKKYCGFNIIRGIPIFMDILGDKSLNHLMKYTQSVALLRENNRTTILSTLQNANFSETKKINTTCTCTCLICHTAVA